MDEFEYVRKMLPVSLAKRRYALTQQRLKLFEENTTRLTVLVGIVPVWVSCAVWVGYVGCMLLGFMEGGLNAGIVSWMVLKVAGYYVLKDTAGFKAGSQVGWVLAGMGWVGLWVGTLVGQGWGLGFWWGAALAWTVGLWMYSRAGDKRYEILGYLRPADDEMVACLSRWSVECEVVRDYFTYVLDEQDRAPSVYEYLLAKRFYGMWRERMSLISRAKELKDRYPEFRKTEPVEEGEVGVVRGGGCEDAGEPSRAQEAVGGFGGGFAYNSRGGM